MHPSRCPPPEAASCLRDLPNIGPRLEAGLLLLGIQHPSQLRGQDPSQLYDELGVMTGQAPDLCVLDVFASIVTYMDTGVALPWWHYTGQRKARQKAA